MIKIKKEKRKKQSEKLYASLTNLEITISANAGDEGKLFGAVTSIDIAKNLKDLGFEVDKRRIILNQPIKQTGKYNVPVKLDDGLTAEIEVTVEKRQ